MTRQVATVAFVILLSPAVLSAQTQTAAPAAVQTTEFRVNTAATIYRSPSTGSPVVGTARRGTVLPVTRELGSWVRVSWPDAEEGAGYVHISSGSLTRTGEAPATRDLTPTMSGPAPMPMMASTSDPTASVQQQPTNMYTGTVYVPQPTHVVGLGGNSEQSSLEAGPSRKGSK